MKKQILLTNSLYPKNNKLILIVHGKIKKVMGA